MEDKTAQYKIKNCECGNEMTPSLYPDHEFTEPNDNNESFVTGVIPAWICTSCGQHMLVRKEEMSDWLFANIRWQRSIVTAMNIVGELAEIHEMVDSDCCEECDDCNNCEDLEDSEEDNEGKVIH